MVKLLWMLVSLATVPAFVAGRGQSSNTTEQGQAEAHAVYSMTNGVGGNEVMVFSRAADGTLTAGGRFATGGKGTGALVTGSQDGIELTRDGRFLLVVNAGSNDLTAFAVGAAGLQRTAIVSSGGKKPVSVTVHGNLVYVLDVDGGKGSINGFTLGSGGDLTPLPNSSRQVADDPLALPSDVEFSPDGHVLVVPARYSGPEHAGRIYTFTVGSDGRASTATAQPSVGRTPFAFAFTPKGVLLVSESFETAPGRPIPKAGKTSSYRISSVGRLQAISRSVPAMGTATCWVEMGKTGQFAYVTNTASMNITAYGVGADGDLKMLSQAPTGHKPLDMAISADGSFLYAINGVDGSISAFRVNATDGGLTPIQTLDFAPNSAFGLAAL